MLFSDYRECPNVVKSTIVTSSSTVMTKQDAAEVNHCCHMLECARFGPTKQLINTRVEAILHAACNADASRTVRDTSEATLPWRSIVYKDNIQMNKRSVLALATVECFLFEPCLACKGLVHPFPKAYPRDQIIGLSFLAVRRTQSCSGYGVMELNLQRSSILVHS